MWTDQALLKLSDKNKYHRNDLFQAFFQVKPDLTDSAFRWTLYNMQQKERIYKTGYNEYSIKKIKTLPAYKPIYSKHAREVMNLLKKRLPKLDFVTFESVLLNEFLNHQIAQNTIYVQVEKDLSSYVFDILQEEYNGGVLYKPSKEEFNRYWIKNCIVVLDLISQAPLSVDLPHEITVEKLLVDIIAEKSIAATFSLSELSSIFRDVMNSYQVDSRRLNRYAGRRGKTTQVKKYMQES